MPQKAVALPKKEPSIHQKVPSNSSAALRSDIQIEIPLEMCQDLIVVSQWDSPKEARPKLLNYKQDYNKSRKQQPSVSLDLDNEAGEVHFSNSFQGGIQCISPLARSIVDESDGECSS